MKFKALIRNFCPPILFEFLQSLRAQRRLSFSGDYSSWVEAQAETSGYDTDIIFNRVYESALKVKLGEAVFERDSVCFYKEEFRWEVLACLLFIASKKGGSLNVLDFGGALGSFYFQHKKFLQRLKSHSWSVIEQHKIVECGKREFQNEHLKFYYDLNDFFAEKKVDVILLSSVLHYLEKPEDILIQLSEIDADYIIVDRTPFIQNSNDRLTVQTVPESIYKASYPAWIFSEERFNRLINQIGFQKLSEFKCDDDLGIGQYKGFIFERILS